TVNVGINGTLPGWSLLPDPDHASGFDVALIEFLRKKYDFMPEYSKLRPAEREGALTSSRVKLVAASFSWTPGRQEHVNFAGPYFHDRSGIKCSQQKIDCNQPIPQEKICVTKGTIAEKNLPYAVKKSAIGECMQAFYDAADESVAAISTDETILLAYGHN